MAENEYLDSTKARRWLSVAERIRDGCDLDELTRLVQERFYRTLRGIWRGLPLPELVAVVRDLDELRRAYDQITGARDVKDILLQAAIENTDRVSILEQFVDNALQSCLHDIPWLAAQLSENVNLSDADRTLDEVRKRLAPDLRRIAERWAANPSWCPRRLVARGSRAAQVGHTRDMLGESLLAGFRK